MGIKMCQMSDLHPLDNSHVSKYKSLVFELIVVDIMVMKVRRTILILKCFKSSFNIDKIV